MSQEVRNLEPKALWNHFADLNAVPRPSKKEERVIQFMLDFGNSLGFPTEVDHIGNVIIKKPASKGYENRTPIVMQSHLDMVHQKNNATEFDFDTEGIRMLVDGDWVKADGTTLGADNGIGVATIMAVLASNDIEHPAIDALFTIDEETGMTGALELQGGMISGKILLNLDTEDDNELTIGCAGGVDVTAHGSYDEESLDGEFVGMELKVMGLSGGHSGMDIIKGLGNANKLLTRLLYKSYEQFGLRIAKIEGGGLRNAIPREAEALVAIPSNQEEAFLEHLEEFSLIISEELGTTDPDFKLKVQKADAPSTVMNEDDQDLLMAALYACPNGIHRMSPEIEGLVQTSNNIARVEVMDGNFKVLCLTRSSSESEKSDQVTTIEAAFMASGAVVDLSGDYPGWQPRPGSPVVSMMNDLYEEMFNEKAHVMACHAGLECGILGTNYPEMDMVSFGPNIRGAHSPDEKVQISSVQKFWSYLLEALKRVK